MEPNASSVNRLEKFSNLPGCINFNLYKQLFIVNINAKGLEVSLQPQDANDLTAAKLLAATRADAQLLFELLNSIDKEPRSWALLNYPITEKPVQWAGFLLWNAIKIRYESKAIPQEMTDLALYIGGPFDSWHDRQLVILCYIILTFLTFWSFMGFHGVDTRLTSDESRPFL